ncbi:SusD/RagB family nutrient-binding outer membrane lipoprotein [Rufibacter sediminis]|uniref:SusD/RagB family nutrient-binding outer membrane lipoprotein n=1 Tax=Rufibacter sediminis TaxID=2762756 RepID=A0ABR6VW01_9BACT|nr:SusD/RagB family nutrient-binding outer membrane lipoprotein [Rufibacter sediminis]MBC3541072.1 SusD/RagB family nutrient-binding outer membrane lipoprotein [Rufibacter sediminis]
MKRAYRYILPFILVGALGLQSCDDYFELSENPNQVTDPALSALLATTTQKAGATTYNVSNITSYFVQYLASPSASSTTDIYDIANYSSTWNSLYLAMADIYDMRQKAITEGSSEYVGVANVLMSYHLTLVTDLFGNAPYSEAFRVDILTPKYDSQEQLYSESLKLLNEAITELSKTDATVKLSPTGDLIYAGDRAKWLKLAYALKARQLNKVSKTSSYAPAEVLTAVQNSFTSNADDAGMNVFPARNYWAGVALSNESNLLGGWLSEQLVDQLNGTTFGVVDPRLPKLATATVTNTYKGTPNGAGNVGPASSTVKDESYISRTSPFTSDESPIYLVTYAELKFVEAEAAFRANDKARAYTAYLEGISASMDKFGVSATDKATYLANPAVGVGAANLTLDLIFKEKYITTYLNPEAWNDARRFDYQYKNFTLPANAALTTFIRRVAYPTDEISRNGANVPAVGSLSERLWWDK